MPHTQDTAQLVTDIEALGEKLKAAKASINQRFIGQDKVVDLVFEQIEVTEKDVSKEDLQKAIEALDEE